MSTSRLRPSPSISGSAADSALPSPSPKWATLEGSEDDLSTSTVAGNAPAELKLFLSNLLRMFRSNRDDGKKGFVDPVGERVRIVSVDLERGQEAEDSAKGKGKAKQRVGARVVCECVVERDMTNAADNMHGGCTGYLIDICSSLPIAASTQMTTGTGYSGVTQAINVVYHAPAPVGTHLEIVSTTMAIGGRTMSARCEIWDKKKKRLIASGVHMKMDPAAGKENPKTSQDRTAKL